MKPAIVAFAGGIGSGKSTLSIAVAQALGWKRVAFGDYVRAEADHRGIAHERGLLQELGAELVSVGWETFCSAVLSYGRWRPGEPLILDGIRHAEILPALQRLVAPLNLHLIYISVDDATRQTRVNQRPTRKAEALSQLEHHSTEVQVRDGLPMLADLRLDGAVALEDLVDQMLEWVTLRLADNT